MGHVSRNNTVVLKSPRKMQVILYSTKVVEQTPSKIKLNTGGYNTATTRSRMNQAANEYGMGYRVYQHKGRLYACYDGVEKKFRGGKVTFRRK